MKISFFVLLLAFSSCSSVPNLVSADQEKQMGEEAYVEVKKQEKISNDPHLNEMVKRVAGRIAQVANQPDFKWEFTVFDSKEANAFCLPGGKVGVYTGIAPIALNEAGLAVVLGHEIAHATLHHGAKRVSQGMLLQYGLSIFDATMVHDSKYRSIILGGLGVGLQGGVVLPFSRENETDADVQGTLYMAQAGYDPAEAPKLWERFAQMNAGHAPPKLLSDHPTDADRLKRLTALQPQAQELYKASPKYGIGEKL